MKPAQVYGKIVTMSGIEINAFPSDVEKDSSMPPWKRVILERRKAKNICEVETCSSAVPALVNDEVHGENPSSKNRELDSKVISNRNGITTTASWQSAGMRIFTPTFRELTSFRTNRTTWSSTEDCNKPIAEKDRRCRREQQSTVLLDSLGPLQDNPFIKLERQRKRRQDQENTVRSIQHILDLYSNVPYIRTICAENIIIIETDPDYIPDSKTDPKLQQNSTYNLIKNMLDPKGTAVTKMNTALNSEQRKSEKHLNTFGCNVYDLELERVQGERRVSSMLEKFDQNYNKLLHRSHSSENLVTEKFKQQLNPSQTSVTPPRSNSPVFNSKKAQRQLVIQSSECSWLRPQILSSDENQESNMLCTGSPQSMSLFPQKTEEEFECSFPVNPYLGVVRSQTETLRERNLCSEGVSTKPKEPRSLERPKDDSDDPSLCVRPHSPTYEIRPSPLPDLSALPADDIQARALANLRLQSRNSFTVIPKRRRPDMPSHRAVPSSDRAVIPSCSKPALSPNPQHRVTEMQDVEVPRPSVLPPACTSPSMTKEEGTVLPKAVPDPQPDPPVDAHSTPSPSIQLILDPPVKALLPEDPMLKDQLPVTKTANVSVEPPQAAISSAVLFRKGNTFTVVPKCTVYTESASLAPQQPPSQAPKQAPYAELGSLLKKRYPKAEEIEVVGGYVSLSRSCLSKTSARKKLKISFNESCLHSTFEYPSESSQWDSEEDQNGEEAREEGDTGTTRFLIPCSNLKSCPILSTNSINLSSYTPKHTVDFSAWKESKHGDHVYEDLQC